MVELACPSCQTALDLPDGHRHCSACGAEALLSVPGLSPPGEDAVDQDRGKALSIAAISFASAGLALFQGFGLIGLVLGIIALARGVEPGSTWKTLSIVAVCVGGLAVAFGVLLLLVLGGLAWI